MKELLIIRSARADNVSTASNRDFKQQQHQHDMRSRENRLHNNNNNKKDDDDDVDDGRDGENGVSLWGLQTRKQPLIRSPASRQLMERRCGNVCAILMPLPESEEKETTRLIAYRRQWTSFEGGNWNDDDDQPGNNRSVSQPPITISQMECEAD